MDRSGRLFYGFIAIFGFILSLQLLGESTQEIAPLLQNFFTAFIKTDLSALGTGWMMAYIVLNGATSAAIGLALFESGLITFLQTYMVISGSRLGAAFIVIFIGVLEYTQGKSDNLADSCSVGILTFLLTYTVYIPAVLIGYVLLETFELAFLETSGPVFLNYSLTMVFTPIVDMVSQYVMAPLLFFLSILLLLFSLKQFDKAFKGLGKEKMREDYIRFLITNRWIAFLAGSILTLLTTSVALSLGIIVPLYNKGYLKREEIIPYILGANVTTMISSIIAAIVLDSIIGMKAVLMLTITITFVTLIVLVLYKPYYQSIKTMFDSILADKRLLYGFVGSLLILPLLLIFI